MSSPLPRDWRPDRPDLLDLHCSCIEPWGTVGNGREPWAAKSLKSIKNASVYAGQKRLRIGCSTTELPRPLRIKDLLPCLAAFQKFASDLRCSPLVFAICCPKPFPRKAPLLLTDRCGDSDRGRRDLASETLFSPGVHRRIRSHIRRKKILKLILVFS